MQPCKAIGQTIMSTVFIDFDSLVTVRVEYIVIIAGMTLPACSLAFEEEDLGMGLLRGYLINLITWAC